MLEKDPEGLFAVLFCSNIEHCGEIIIEKRRKGEVPIIKVRSDHCLTNFEKSGNGPFIQMVPDSVKIFPKKFGYTMKRSGEYVIFR
ncbi:MAG: hypothetical protein WC788_00285 [Candidatus Paceibacterota bacterium]